MKYLLALLLFLPMMASAECYCTCINGSVQPLCSNVLDIRPICAPRICPIAPPSIRPITPPAIPPIGTYRCGPEFVYDFNLGRYVWKQVCR